MPNGSGVRWAECLLIIGTGCRVQVFSLILDSSVGLSAGIQSAEDWVSETLWVRILHSAEEDNVSPFDSKIACLCQSIEINNNKYAIYCVLCNILERFMDWLISPSATYMRRWTGSSFVQVMACRLLGAKPLPEPMLDLMSIWPLGTNISEIWIELQTFSLIEMHFKMSSAKLRSLWGDESNCSDGQTGFCVIVVWYRCRVDWRCRYGSFVQARWSHPNTARLTRPINVPPHTKRASQDFLLQTSVDNWPRLRPALWWGLPKPIC